MSPYRIKRFKEVVMPTHSLFPSFVRLNYTSLFGAHIATLPTRQWSPGGGTDDSGTFLAWDDSDRDAQAMIVDFATLLADIHRTDTIFDNFTIFSFDSEDAPATPRFSNGLAIPGTVSPGGWTKAVQTTFTWYDTAFNTAKVVMLDSDSANNFGKHTAASLTAAELAIGTEYATLTNAWSSRANLRPATLLSVTQTLNEKLRRTYKDA
jgi:hypothetical protein